MATPGPADTHCAAMGDAAATIQPTTYSSCCFSPDGGAIASACYEDGGGGGGCPYGNDMYGMSGDDDDCKYHVTWTIGTICENTSIPVTLSVTLKGAGAGFPGTASAGGPLPITPGMEVRAEVFTTTPGNMDASTYCDDMSTHPAPGSEFTLNPVTGTPGMFSGNIKFDKSGQWTLRFHIHEECQDVLPDSPHGHAAFLITVN